MEGTRICAKPPQGFDAPSKLFVDLHVRFIQSLDKVSSSCTASGGLVDNHLLLQKRNEMAYHLTEHLRMNGIYWGLTALALMGQQEALPREEMIEWVMSCWNEEVGAFTLRDLGRGSC